MSEKLTNRKILIFISVLILASGSVIGLVIGIARTNLASNDTVDLGKSCRYNGNDYVNREKFPSFDGCNSCSCNDGRVICTARACAQDTIEDLAQ